MNSRVRIGLLMSVFLMVACAPPEEPAALKSSGTGVGEVKVRNKSDAEGALAVNYGGANIGDEQMRATVKNCIDQGKFFDRLDNPKPNCTEHKLATVNCTDATITTIMDAKDKASFESFMKGDLAGYTLDQCMDCSTPVGNSYCEGKAATKVKDPGIRLFLVKQSANTIEIKTVYIYK